MFPFPGKAIKDKRVDRILVAHNIKGAEIFYSPLSVWLLLLISILGTSAGIIIFLFEKYWLLVLPILLIYLLLSYLFAAIYNCSFAIAESGIYIINPNFPFKKINFYDFAAIDKIVVGKRGTFHISNIFIFSESHFLEIETGDRTSRYYCQSLQPDAFDENFTENTLDGLCSSLKGKTQLIIEAPELK